MGGGGGDDVALAVAVADEGAVEVEEAREAGQEDEEGGHVVSAASVQTLGDQIVTDARTHLLADLLAAPLRPTASSLLRGGGGRGGNRGRGGEEVGEEVAVHEGDGFRASHDVPHAIARQQHECISATTNTYNQHMDKKDLSLT